MNHLFSFLLSLSLLYSTADAVTLFVYNDTACASSNLVSSSYYELNVCRDISQGGVSGSMLPISCNSTHASASVYFGTSNCSGTPFSTNTDPVLTCFNDQGTYSKISCSNSSSPPPSPPPTTSAPHPVASSSAASLYVVELSCVFFCVASLIFF